MPLSRLSPRSARSGLKTRNARNRAGNSQRHVQLWAAIKSTRAEIEKWQQQAQMVETLFNKHVAPLEHQFVDAVCDVTETVISIFSQRTQSIANQSLLGLWVNDNLNSLQNHPFANATRLSSLSVAWLDLLSHDGPVENQLAQLASKLSFGAGYHQHTPEQEDADNDEELLFDFGMHSKSTSNKASPNEQTSAEESTANMDSESDKVAEPNDTNHQGRHCDEDISRESLDDKITSLEDKLSIERLFRQLAKVLHPDREQCEVAKAEKHVLMSECLEARKNKDINTLLTLYCEHVGELPDDLTNDSHDELVRALQAQLNQLQQELRQQRFGNPLQAMIVERYCAGSEAECKKRINNHAVSLKAEIDTLQTQAIRLDSDDGLQAALEERRAIEIDKLTIEEMTGY